MLAIKYPDSKTRPELETWLCYLLARWPWASCIIFLSFAFPTCEMGLGEVLIWWGCWKYQERQCIQSTQHSAWCIMGSPRIRAMMTVESVTFVTFLSGMVRRKGAQSLLRPSALLNPCLAGWAVREGSIRVGSWSFIWFFPASEPIIWDFWGLSGRGGFKGPSNQPWFMSKGFQFQKPHHQFLQEKSWTIGADLLTLGLCLRPASENQELSRQSL